MGRTLQQVASGDQVVAVTYRNIPACFMVPLRGPIGQAVDEAIRKLQETPR